MKIPNRKPDFDFPLVGKYKIDVWQLDEHFVLMYKFKNQEITIANKGVFSELKMDGKYQIALAILKSLLDYVNNK